MWPFERPAATVLRLGASCAELWKEDEVGGFARLEQLQFSERASIYDPSAATAALASLATKLGRERVTVVVESAWMPVMAVDTAGILKQGSQVEALLRHRFGLTYGGEGLDCSSWTIRWRHRFGERMALGFALAPEVSALLRDVLSAKRVVAWIPALGWSLDRFRPWRTWKKAGGLWVWSEADRRLIASFEGSRLIHLNPAAPTQGVSALSSFVIRGAADQGLAVRPMVLVGSWQADDTMSDLPDDATSCLSVDRQAPHAASPLGLKTGLRPQPG